ncbi:MAG: hypothetical protein ACE5GS_15400 [Kiloniellaceae bacterium]
MLGRLLKVIFVPKGARATLAARERTGPAGARMEQGRTAGGAARERLLRDAMAVYRRRRTAYESLDEETRARIESDAAKVLGPLLEPKD